MEWFLFALLAPALWGIINILDKFLLTKHFKSPFSYQIFLSFLNLIILPIFLLVSISSQIFFTTLSIIIGLFVALIYVIYNKAMMKEEASRVISLFYLNPLFILPLAFIFLGEGLGISKYLGVILLVISATLISYKKVRRKKILSPAILLILIFDLFYAIYQIITKFTLNYFDIWSFTFWKTIGALISNFVLLSFQKIRNDFLLDIRNLPKSIYILGIFHISFFYTGLILFYFAISISFISLVGAIPSIQPFFVLIYTLLLSIFIPKILKEEVSKQTLLLKSLAVILIFIGSYLIIL